MGAGLNGRQISARLWHFADSVRGKLKRGFDPHRRSADLDIEPPVHKRGKIQPGIVE